MTDKFKARYQVQDGYSGGARPQYFSIRAVDLDDEMTDEELVEFYEGAVQEHFEQNISPGIELVDEFLSWARDHLAKR